MEVHNGNKRIQMVFFLLIVLVYLYCIRISTSSDHFDSTKQLQYDELPRSSKHRVRGPAAAPPLEENVDVNHNMTVRTEVKNGEVGLPQFVIDHIKTFVFFLGHGHSGHSIVGSLMDAHPHMVISHELDVFTKLYMRTLKPTKQDIFNAVWNNTMQTIINGYRANPVKGYDMVMGGLYQGKYVDHIDVIGDKKGGVTAHLLLTQPEKWSDAYNILKSLNVTLKVIQVFRNPYDNIATSVLLQHSGLQTFASIKQSNVTRKLSPSEIDIYIKNYFLHHNTIVNAKEMYNLDIVEIHGKDLISDPRATLLKLCNHLGVHCSNNYLEICSKKVFKTESKTRQLINWTNEQLKTIQQNIDKYSNLQGYSFD